jgi:hypothetical protein
VDYRFHEESNAVNIRFPFVPAYKQGKQTIRSDLVFGEVEKQI